MAIHIHNLHRDFPNALHLADHAGLDVDGWFVPYAVALKGVQAIHLGLSLGRFERVAEVRRRGFYRIFDEGTPESEADERLMGVRDDAPGPTGRKPGGTLKP